MLAFLRTVPVHEPNYRLIPSLYLFPPSKDGVGGTPDVQLVTKSDNIRSELEFEITLAWSFQDARDLQIDLDAIFDGLDLDEDIATFVKGILAFEGSAVTDVGGSLSFTLGIGLEYVKSTKKILPYIKGTTGLELGFAAEAVAEFEATIGPFSADIDVSLEINNFGEPVVIKFGLDSSLNYYLRDQASSQTSTTATGSRRRLQTTGTSSIERIGFANILSVSALKDAVGVSFAGGLKGSVKASLVGVPGEAGAFIELFLPDINCILQQKPSCISIFFETNLIGFDIPSFLDILLMDPRGIIEAVDGLLQFVEDLTIGTKGVVTKFPTPIVGKSLQNNIGAGVPDNFIAKARRNVVGTLEDKLNSYDNDSASTGTVADIIANVLNDLLGDEGINILQQEGITVTYFEHVEILDVDGNTTGNFRTENHAEYDETLPIKSLMWTFPFGQKINIPLPGLNFKLPSYLPLSFDIVDNQPVLEIEWQFKLAFGFDEDDGFFLYTFPEEEESEFFVTANAVILNNVDIPATLLYFLE